MAEQLEIKKEQCVRGLLNPIWTVSHFGLRFEGEGGAAGGGGGTDTPGKEKPAGSDPDDKANPKTYTQEDLNRVGRKEKDEGIRTERERIAAELGIPLEEAKALIAAKRDADDKAKSDAQKAADKAAAETAAAKAEAAKAKLEGHKAVVFRKLAEAGMPIAQIKDRRIMSVEVEVGADEQKIADAIATLKKEEPTWFTGSANENGSAEETPAPGSTITNPGNKKPKVNEAASKAGKDLAKEYNERAKPKKSLLPSGAN